MAMLLTEAQAAAELQIDKRTLRKLILSGRLRAVDVGSGGRRHFRIAREDLREIDARQPDGPTMSPRARPRPRAATRLRRTSAEQFLPTAQHVTARANAARTSPHA